MHRPYLCMRRSDSPSFHLHSIRHHENAVIIVIIVTLLLLVLRPKSDIEKRSPQPLVTPPAPNSPPPYKPLRNGPPELGLSPPHGGQQSYDGILHVQEIAEDNRLRLRELCMRQEGQDHLCIDDSETTLWLKHTGWPQWFRNRPLDIIAASGRLPVRHANAYNEDLVLGRWKGQLLPSTAANEAWMRVLMRAVDTLTRTPYQSRCWLTSYQQGMFQHRPLRVMAAATARSYKSKWNLTLH